MANGLLIEGTELRHVESSWGNNYIFSKSQWERMVKEQQAKDAIKDQRIRHLEEEIERLKKALRIADEAVNIATGE